MAGVHLLTTDFIVPFPAFSSLVATPGNTHVHMGACELEGFANAFCPCQDWKGFLTHIIQPSS